MTTANLRPIDQKRAGQLLAGWLRSDRLAIDTAINDAADDPAGTAGLLFGMVTIAAALAVTLAPDDAEAQIVAALIHLAREHPEDGAQGA